MKKSLSLLVAIAMVFSMFAAVASAAEETKLTTEQKYEELVKAGLFEGYPDGEAHLDKEMTRAQASKIVALLTGYSEGVEVKDAGYTDLVGAGWATDYINYATQVGILEGKGNNKFDPSAQVTVQQLATIAVKLAKQANVEVPAGEEVEGKVDAWAADAVASAIAAGLLAKQDDYTVNANRGVLVEVVYSAKEILEQANAPAISAKATGAKKIEVKFNKAIDSEKAKFTVKKGTVSVNVSKTTVSEDNKTVVLETASKLTAGEYTVTVAGIEDKDVTAKFTAENEKVAKIEFLSKNAPLVAYATNATDKTKVRVPYQVLNNYGENVTKTTSLNSNIAASAGGVNAAKGYVEVEGFYRVNDPVVISLIHAETATTAIETFTVAAPARIAELNITGLYNKDKKVLDDSVNLATDAFYLLVEGKDQYGNVVTDVANYNDDVIINQTNTTVVNVANSFAAVEVDGSDKAALRLNNPTGGSAAKVGQNTVMLISNTQGKSAQFNIVVAETVRADVVNLVNPGEVFANEDAYVPVEVFDKEGNAITDVRVLNNSAKGVTVSVGSSSITNPFVTKDGAVQIKIDKSHLTVPGQITVIAQSASYKITSLVLTVKDASVPKVIRSLKSDFAKAYKTSLSGKVLKATNFVIEDQHGRVMTDAQVDAWLLNANHKIEIVAVGTPASVQFTGTTVEIIANTGTTFSTTAVKGTDKFTVSLITDGTNAIPSSSTVISLTATDGTEYTSYAVDNIGKVYDVKAVNNLYAGTDYNKEIKVYGVLANGDKVKLDGTEFFATALGNTSVDSLIEIDGNQVVSLDVTQNAVSGYATDKNELVVPVTVTINRTGKTFVQDVTFSKEAAKIDSVKFVAGNVTDLGTAGKTTINVSGGTVDAADLFAGTTANDLKVVVTDQYGARAVANGNGSVTLKDASVVNATYTFTIVSGNVDIDNNGKDSATATAISGNAEVDLTVTFAGGKTATVRVNL